MQSKSIPPNISGDDFLKQFYQSEKNLLRKASEYTIIKNEESIAFNKGIDANHKVETILIYADPNCSEKYNTLNYALSKEYIYIDELIKLCERFPDMICNSNNTYNTLYTALLKPYTELRIIQSLLSINAKPLFTQDTSNILNMIIEKGERYIKDLFEYLFKREDAVPSNASDISNTLNLALKEKCDYNIIKMLLTKAQVSNSQDNSNTFNHVLEYRNDYEEILSLIQHKNIEIKPSLSQNIFNTMTIALNQKIKSEFIKKLMYTYKVEPSNAPDISNTLNMAIKNLYDYNMIEILLNNLCDSSNSQNESNTLSVILFNRTIDFFQIITLLLIKNKILISCDSQDKSNTLNIALRNCGPKDIQELIQKFNLRPSVSDGISNTLNHLLNYSSKKHKGSFDLFVKDYNLFLSIIKDLKISNSQDKFNTLNIAISRGMSLIHIRQLIDEYKGLPSNSHDEFNTLNYILQHREPPFEPILKLFGDRLTACNSQDKFNTLSIAILKGMNNEHIKQLIDEHKGLPSNSQDEFNTLNYILQHKKPPIRKLLELFGNLLTACNSQDKFNTMNIALTLNANPELIKMVAFIFKALPFDSLNESDNTILKLCNMPDPHKDVIIYYICTGVSIKLPPQLRNLLPQTTMDMLKIILASNQYQRDEYGASPLKTVGKKEVVVGMYIVDNPKVILIEKYRDLINASTFSHATPELIKFAKELDEICKTNNMFCSNPGMDFMKAPATSPATSAAATSAATSAAALSKASAIPAALSKVSATPAALSKASATSAHPSFPEEKDHNICSDRQCKVDGTFFSHQRGVPGCIFATSVSKIAVEMPSSPQSFIPSDQCLSPFEPCRAHECYSTRPGIKIHNNGAVGCLYGSAPSAPIAPAFIPISFYRPFSSVAASSKPSSPGASSPKPSLPISTADSPSDFSDLSHLPKNLFSMVFNYAMGFPTNNFWINKLYRIPGVKDKYKYAFSNKYIKYKMKYIKLKNSL